MYIIQVGSKLPGAEILGNPERHDELEGYIKGVTRHFANDDRVLIWDVYNEPDNVAHQKGRRGIGGKEQAKIFIAIIEKSHQMDKGSKSFPTTDIRNLEGKY